MSVSPVELIVRAAAAAVDQYCIEYKRKQKLIQLKRKRRRKTFIILLLIFIMLFAVGIVFYNYWGQI